MVLARLARARLGAKAADKTTESDQDGDGIPDRLQRDADGDGIPDILQGPKPSDASRKSSSHSRTREIVDAAESQLRNDILRGGLTGKGEAVVREMMSNLGFGDGEKLEENITQTKWFHGMVACTILFNALTMGIETDYPQHTTAYEVLENLFTLVYTFEMVAKLYYERSTYFKDGWNILDFTLVWMSIVDVWILGLIGRAAGLQQFAALRMLRIVRVVRMVRLLRFFRDLWLLVKGMLDSVLTIFWASLLVIMLLYVGGIFCVQTIGKSGMYLQQISEVDAGEEVDYHPDFDSYEFYGTVPRAMFTLFETCLEPLNLRPIVEKQPELFPFFLTYIFLTTFGVMNVIIGVIVDNTMAANKATEADVGILERQEKMKKIEQIRDACFIFDANGDGFITIEELKKGLSEPAISECLKDLNFPLGGDEEELFQLLDTNGTGEVTHEKMMRGLFRSIAQTERMHILELKASIHCMQRMVRKVTGATDANSEQLSNVAGTLKQRLSRIENNGKALRGTLRDIAIVGMGGAPTTVTSLEGSSEIRSKAQKKYLGVWSARDKEQIVPKIASSGRGGESGRSTPQGLPATPRGGAPQGSPRGSHQTPTPRGARTHREHHTQGTSHPGNITPGDITPRSYRDIKETNVYLKETNGSRSSSPSGSSVGRQRESMRTPPGLGNLLGQTDIDKGSSGSRDPFENFPVTPKS